MPAHPLKDNEDIKSPVYRKPSLIRVYKFCGIWKKGKIVFRIYQSKASAMEVDVIADAEQDVLSSDNQPTPEILSKYRLAGHFCSVAIKAVIAKCVPGTNPTALCQIGDDAILAQVIFPEVQWLTIDGESVSIERKRNC